MTLGSPSSCGIAKTIPAPEMEKLIVTNNYVHIGEKDGSWKTYTAVTDFTQASGESAPSADATVFAAAIGDGVTRTPEAGETIAFGGAA